jgi:hypothetical protein
LERPYISVASAGPPIYLVQGTSKRKGVIRVLVDYQDEIEEIKRITEEGWDRL